MVNAPELHGIWRLTAGFILAVFALILVYDGIVVLIYGDETSITQVMRWAFRRSPSFFAFVLLALGWLLNHVSPVH